MLPGDPEDKLERMFNTTQVMHPFTHVRLTPKGIDLICEYVAEVRAVVGDEVPIAADHFGHIGIDDCLRLGQALEPYNLAWLEDLVPWQFTDKWVQLERALQHAGLHRRRHLPEGGLPAAAGGARRQHHPPRPRHQRRDPGDEEDRRPGAGIRHQHGAAHGRHADQHDGERPCAAATENFIALEHHFSAVAFLKFIDKPATADRAGPLIGVRRPS